MSRLSFLCVLFMLLGTVSPAFAQIHFEAATIRISGPGATPQNARTSFTSDGFDAENTTVGDILDMLNNWQLMRVFGGPAWMRTDRYDIHAKADGPVSKEDQKAALMALLADRFQLSVHSETRDIPAAALLAPKTPAGIKPAPPGESTSISYGADLVFTVVSMSTLANRLSQIWNMPVIDQTGLKGNFDFSLKVSEVTTQPGESYGERVREAVTALGFRIEEKKLPTDVTVVDRLERPSAN